MKIEGDTEKREVVVDMEGIEGGGGRAKKMSYIHKVSFLEATRNLFVYKKKMQKTYLCLGQVIM